MAQAGNATRRAFIVGAGAVLASPAFAGKVYTPGRGDPDRKAILDSIRPKIEAEMRGPVEFVVRVLNVKDGWAFAVLDPQRPGGKPINPYETTHAADAEYMDGLTVYALARKTGNRWNLIDSVTGPTDVAYEPWPDWYGAPRAIFGF